MTDLPSIFYIYFRAWRKGPYFCTITVSSRHTLSVTFGLPLLSPSLFYLLMSKLFFAFLVILLLPSSSFSLISSVLPTSVFLKKCNIGPIAYSFPNKLLSHLFSGRSCHLIPNWPNSLLSFLRSLFHLRHPV